MLLCFDMDGDADTQKSVNWWSFVFGIEMKAGDEVSFGEVAMEKQSFWNGLVKIWELLWNAENEITTKM